MARIQISGRCAHDAAKGTRRRSAHYRDLFGKAYTVGRCIRRGICSACGFREFLASRTICSGGLLARDIPVSIEITGVERTGHGSYGLACSIEIVRGSSAGIEEGEIDRRV